MASTLNIVISEIDTSHPSLTKFLTYRKEGAKRFLNGT